MILVNTMIITVLNIFFLPKNDILAYLDPGTGSFLVQLLIGGIVGALVFLKAYWTKIRAFFSKQDNTTTSDEEKSDTDLSDE